MSDFNRFQLDDKLINSLLRSGIKKATEVQEKVIPYVLEKKDLIVQSPTGSGKTLAYLLPILQDYEKQNDNTQTLILAPTRELVLQIENEIDKIVAEFHKISIYGGREISSQITKLKAKPRVIIATTGRMMDIIKKGEIELSNIRRVILDEADQMIDMGFREDIEFIFSKLSKKKNTLCFSATINVQTKKLLYRITDNPIFIKLDKNSNPLENIEQFYFETTDRRKIDYLSSLLNELNPFLAIIFCRTKARVDKLENNLSLRGFSCQKIHSDIPQVKREKIIKSFRNLEFQFLVATDIVSRGLDVLGVTHIFNYDSPEDIETYIHRIGRTGRAEEKGYSYLFVTDKNQLFFQELCKNNDIKKLELEYIPDVKSTLILPEKKYSKKVNTKTKNIEKMKNRYRK